MLMQVVLKGKTMYLPVTDAMLVLDGFKFVDPRRAKVVCLIAKAEVTTDGGLAFSNTQYASVVEILDTPEAISLVEAVSIPPEEDTCGIFMNGDRLQFVKVI